MDFVCKEIGILYISIYEKEKICSINAINRLCLNFEFITLLQYFIAETNWFLERINSNIFNVKFKDNSLSQNTGHNHQIF